MKHACIAALVAVLGIGSAFAAISAKKVETAKASAARSGKLIAFVFYQGYYAPNCPKCVAEVNGNNASAKRAIPKKDVVVIEVSGKEKDIDEGLPSVVSKTGTTPRIVVTDADCGQVVAEIKNGATKEELEAFEKKIEEARPAKR
jgi:thiol-disulfide isomerase/thioredoxin